MRTTFTPEFRRATVYSVTDVAAALGLYPTTLWRYIYRDGVFPRPTVRIGRRLFYTQSEYDRIVSASTAGK